MPIDMTPATVATSALQALPFNSLISGPLKACVQAQAMAAQTSSSSGSEQTESSTVGAKAGGSAGGGAPTGGRFVGGSANFKASYSSKKDSKASRESRYSVEYTMDVHVHAAQADMPAGLVAVLGMLEQVISEGGPSGKLEVSPARAALDKASRSSKEILATLTDGKGLLAKDAEVTFSVDTAPGGFSVEAVKGTLTENWDQGRIKVKTDPKGQAAIRMVLGEAAQLKPAVKLKIESALGSESLSQEAVLQIANLA